LAVAPRLRLSLGIEVKFNPQLDEVFGIANDKQTVRPIEDFWRLLASERSRSTLC